LKTVFGIILLLAFFFLSPSYPKAETSAGPMKKSAIGLTPEEETWVRDHQTIRVGMSPVFPPLKFSENGVIKGIEPDYLNLLSELTGLQFEYIICDFSLMDAKVKSGEMDMFISFYIPERLAYMTFTQPLMEFKQVIIARADTPFMSGIGALKGKKVATVKGVKLYEKLLSPYPDIDVVQVGTMEEMFKAVSEFKADALISRTYIAGYVMQNYPNLKIAGIAELPPEPFLYAIRKDYPELVEILNKAIASITRDRHDAIVQKWFSVRIEYRPNWFEILKWAFVIGGVFMLLMGISLLWNRRLSREIDKRKQTEAALLRNEHELKEKNAELIRFSYAVSHDLKSPLVTILAFLGYLENDIRNQDTARTELDIGYIRTAAEKMGRLLDELRNLSQIGRVKSDSVELSFQKIVREALTLVAGRIAEKGAQVEVTEEPVILRGDHCRLVEVFQNLIDNAVKFMGKQVAPRIEIGAEKNGDEIVLFVRDNGTGIDPRHQEKVFGLFEKLDSHAEGTGMGLALVKRIVEIHGGGIWVESEGPGRGTCFRFTLAGTKI
jgi:signal transduction histidine kinase